MKESDLLSALVGFVVFNLLIKKKCIAVTVIYYSDFEVKCDHGHEPYLRMPMAGDLRRFTSHYYFILVMTPKF